MGRRANENRMKQVFDVIQKHPGARPGFIAQLLGLQRSAVTRLLPNLEELGYLLSEDDRGRLWPFQKEK